MPISARTLNIFKNETCGHLKKIREGLERHCSLSQSSGTIKEMHRSAHTIKGTAGLLGLNEIASLASRLEIIFEKVQDGHSVLLGDCSGAVDGLLRDLQLEMDDLQEIIFKIETKSALSAAEAQAPDKNILIVEDEPLIADLLKETLLASDACRANIYTTFTLEDTKQLLATKHFDLILLDLTLPDSVGLATLTAVQSNCRGAEIIVMTGYREEIVAQFKKEGVSAILIKGTFNSLQLQNTVAKLIQKSRQFPP